MIWYRHDNGKTQSLLSTGRPDQLNLSGDRIIDKLSSISVKPGSGVGLRVVEDRLTLLKLAYSHIFPLITHAPVNCDKAAPDIHHQTSLTLTSHRTISKGISSEWIQSGGRAECYQHSRLSSLEYLSMRKLKKTSWPLSLFHILLGNKGSLIDPFLPQERLTSQRSEIWWQMEN